jgi:hypothetical protein
MKQRSIHIIVIIATMVALFAGCAKIVTPSGGPKDTTPPKVVKVEPADGSVHFNEKHIRIHFDEYITLNNPNDNVLVSPPLSKTPEYTINGKTLVIKFKDTLRANTTYNMVFSNCFKDYHESNPLDYFHYSFSTGDSLDNYMIRGNILDAKTLAPVSELFVMLYRNNTDSFPLTTLPDYVTKSLSDGSFVLKNIKQGSYKIFAIKDINTNFLYDLPNEEIAFLEGTVDAFQAVPDSAADSLKAELPLITLFSFTANDSVQKLLRYETPAAGIYKFPYKMRFANFSATPLTREVEYFELINSTRDTITWYMKAPLTDTVEYLFTADNHTDTVRITPFKEKVSTGRGRTKPVKKLQPTFIHAGEYHLPLTLQFPYPVRPTDTFSVWVYSQQQSKKDTLELRLAVPDTFTMQLPIVMDVTEKKSYNVMIRDSVFFGYNGLTNDTLRVQFTTKSIKDYGTLIMNYQLPDDGKQYVATLWLKDKIVQEDVLTSSQTITYPFLNPDSYRVSIFCDENGNGRWDPGNYHGKSQPEKMFNFPQVISIRAYWESEETFLIEN